jgi:hypothetical protein
MYISLYSPTAFLYLVCSLDSRFGSPSLASEKFGIEDIDVVSFFTKISIPVN